MLKSKIYLLLLDLFSLLRFFASLVFCMPVYHVKRNCSQNYSNEQEHPKHFGVKVLIKQKPRAPEHKNRGKYQQKFPEYMIFFFHINPSTITKIYFIYFSFHYLASTYFLCDNITEQNEVQQFVLYEGNLNTRRLNGYC